MFNKALFNNDEMSEKEKDKEFTEEDYEQINKEISKALIEMKNVKQDDILEEEINETEKELNNFDYDFFSDKSSISNDNMSDLSDNSFRSANVEMNKINSLKKNMMNNNFNININNVNNFSGITKDVSNSSKEGTNESLKLKQKSFNSEQNERNQKNKNNILNLENQNNSFNSSPFLINVGNSKFNFLNESNNLNMNNNINNINNSNNINIFHNNQNLQMMQQHLINSINNNPNNNVNNQPIINNNLNFLNVNNNYFNYNNPLNNMNLINFNNINNNQYLINNNTNNFISFSPMSEKVFPVMYNLDSPKNIINLDNILKSRDKRTTLIIRNIPNKYTISLLLEELNHNFENKYDIVYLPQDYINNSNLGFGFINFVNHMHLILFYDEFVGKKWNCFNSKKRCQLAYSKYQGKNELMKYIHTKLGISNLDNNNENIKKSFFINHNKNIRAPIEMPIKYYANFISFYPFSSCHNKDDKVFIIDKYYNV